MITATFGTFPIVNPHLRITDNKDDDVAIEAILVLFAAFVLGATQSLVEWY